MKNNPLKRISLKKMVLFIILGSILVPTLFACLYFYISISTLLTANSQKALEQNITQTVKALDSSLNMISTTSLKVSSASSIRDWFAAGNSSDQDYYELLKHRNAMEEDLVYNMMFDTAWDSRLINTAYLFLTPEVYCSVSRSSRSTEEVNRNNLLMYDRFSRDEANGIIFYPPSRQDPTIYSVRAVSYYNDPSKQLFLSIGTLEEALYGICAVSPSSILYLVNDDGIIFSCHDKTLLGQTLDSDLLSFANSCHDGIPRETSLQGSRYFLAASRIGAFHLTYIVGVPKSEVLSGLSTAITQFAGTILLILGGCLLAGLLFSLSLSRFLDKLLTNISLVGEGEYHNQMPYYDNPDLNRISTTFNQMTAKINHLIHEVYEEQLMRKDAEIKLLHSQMNPHFLFNTLTAIGYRAQLSGDSTLYEMVAALSELMQANIYRDRTEKVRISEELEYIRLYLFLQKMRFGEKLQYHISVEDPGLPDCFIPKLSIEPIVENAVVHGFETRIHPGPITLAIRRQNKDILFEVTDGGTGFPDEILALFQKNDIPRTNRVGICNTHQRIRLIYGPPYGLRPENLPGGGARVTIRVPVDLGGDLPCSEY